MNILTFDVEEWFHILDHESTRAVAGWSGYESRIRRNMDRIVGALQQRNQKATFFCLGWIAQQYPEVIRDLVSAGYEIGSHGFSHQLVYEQTKDDFQKDLDLSIKVFEDIAGEKIRYYRAPGFSIREDSSWAFEILALRGIEVDCSVFPAPRAHGGFPSYRAPVPSILKSGDIRLKELPISYVTIAGKPLIFSGGGYFRIFPYRLIKGWTGGSNYVMSYLHPRDFDADQPWIPGLPPARLFKSYVGLAGALGKLQQWMDEFTFVDIKTALELIDWRNVPVVDVT
jgi:polysaccharide deacetylase family protein (PEP-CTERM system associated)